MMRADFESYLRYELNRSPLTIEAYLRDLKEFESWLEKENCKSLENAESLDIRRWLACITQDGLSSRSARRKTQSLRAFYRFLQKRGDAESNPAADVATAKIAKQLPEFINESDLEEILNTTATATDMRSQRDHLILNLLYSTGIRQAELLAINDSHINFFSEQILINGKRSKQRVVPVHKSLLQEIAEWQKSRDNEWPAETDSLDRPLIAVKGRRMSRQTLYNIVNRLLTPAGCNRKSPHTIRHSFATAMLNDGADLNSVKEFLGHASLQSTQIYTHLTAAQLRQAYSEAHPRCRAGSEKK